MRKKERSGEDVNRGSGARGRRRKERGIKDKREKRNGKEVIRGNSVGVRRRK